MTAPEKAAPIPAEVLALAKATAIQMLGDAWRAADVQIIASAIMQDRADRFSQEERIREDERGVEWFERTFGVPLGDRSGAADVAAVRARLRGGTRRA